MAKPANKKKPKNVGGRPVKITDNIIEQIRENLLVGAYIETASAMAGINKDTFYAWLKRGARALDKVRNANGIADPENKKIPNSERKFAKFSDAIKRTMAESEIDLLKKLDSHSSTHWQSIAWRLERKFPDRYGRKIHGTVGIGVGDGRIEDARTTPGPVPAKDIETEEDVHVIDPKNPPTVYVTLNIGDKEVSLEDYDGE